MTVPADAAATRPYFARASIGETRYAVLDPEAIGTSFAPPAFTALVELDVGGHALPGARAGGAPGGATPLRLCEARTRSPAGGRADDDAARVLIVPSDGKPHTIDVQVDAVAYATIGASGDVRLEAPQGWTTTPQTQAFA